MNKVLIQSILPAKWHSYLALVAFLFLGTFAHAQSAPPDLTTGAAPTDAGTITLGPTGLRGWVYEYNGKSADSRQLLVKVIDAGSPADGIFQVDDVILGADGTGASPANFTSDARKALAYAIADAEARNPATLKLLRWRAGTTETVQITLQTMGAYSATAPYNCPKSALILEQGLQYVMDHEQPGKFNLGILPLLAGNDPLNPNNAARQARVQADIQAMLPSAEELALMNSNDVENWTTKIPWRRGHELIVLCEYYLQTGDTSVLPAIDAHVNTISKGQSMFGTIGHAFAGKKPDGTFNGPYDVGYGAINSAGLPCFSGIVMAKKCGNTNPKLDDAIERGKRFFGSYAGKGTIPYGEHGPSGGYTSNGRSGLAAITFALLEDRLDVRDFYAQMATAGASAREGGHTGYYFNAWWTPLGAAVGGEDAAAYHFSQIAWHLDLSRRWDGGFDYSNLGQSVTTMSGIKMFIPALLTYALPLQQLEMTGRGRSAQGCLTAAQVADAAAAELYVPTLRSTAELMVDLGSWAPQMRSNAASELATRDSETTALLPTLHAMASDPNGGNSRLGACMALGRISNDASTPILAALLTDSDSEVRRLAANALRYISVPAKLTVINTILEAAASTAKPLLPLDDEDPLQLAHGELAYVLFGDGGNGFARGALYDSIDGIDRDLLYPAVRALAATPNGSNRANLRFFYPLMTEEDFEALADVVMDSVQYRAPADKMFSNHIRIAGMEALWDRELADVIPLSKFFFETDPDMLASATIIDMFADFGGTTLAIKPDPDALGFLDAMAARSINPQVAIDAIEDDVNPAPPVYLKSIQSVTADATSLNLPANQTQVHVAAAIIGQDELIYTWGKVRGAGGVSFSPNGTASAKDSVVTFDGTPGSYLLEVTVSDTRGFTEVSATIEVTLRDANGNLPPNSAPVATSQSVSGSRQQVPIPITLSGVDPDGLPLIYTITRQPAQGWITGTAPNLVYTTNPLYVGTTDSFVFEVTDSEGLSDQATVTVNLDNSFPDIIWVSSARDGVIPAEWNALLTGAGYTVTGFVGRTDPNTVEQAFLNAAPLIIYENGNRSGLEYPAGLAEIWNRLQPPLIQLDANSIDDWNWAPWNKSSGAVSSSSFPPTVHVPGDPIWNGVTLPLEGSLVTTKQRVRSSETMNYEGIRIAGDAGQTAIARWPAGAMPTKTYRGGKRMFFAGVDGAGVYGLTPLGETVFLNAVADMLDATPRVSAPSVWGFSQADAESAIAAAQLVVGTITTTYSETVPAGMVINQGVAPRSFQAPGAAVDLVISLGPRPMTTVPDLVGLSQATAESNLSAALLTLGSVLQDYSETVESGKVISQSITSGSSVLQGSGVDLVVSLGSTAGAATELVALRGTSESYVNWTNVGGSGNPRTRWNESNLMDGSGLATNASGKLVHTNDAATAANHHSNVEMQDTAGLIIDLGAEYKISAMQVWNFNALSASHSAQRFDFKYATDTGAVLLDNGKLRVADLSKFTTLTNDTPLPISNPYDNPDYLGETFTFGQGVLPAELGDQSGAADSLSASTITARYIFLDDMLGGIVPGNPPSPAVGLAEVQFYAYGSENYAPAFTSGRIVAGNASEDSPYSGSLAAFVADLDGDQLVFSKLGGPTWLEVAADGSLSGTPANRDVGTNTFTVSVTDGIAPAVAATLSITVINTNDAPVWSADPINIADAGVDSAFSGTIRTFATDEDSSDTLAYAKVSGPAWLTVDTGGTLSGTPSVGDLGPNTFTVSVTDGIASPVEATLEINVAESASSLTEGSFFIVGSGSTTTCNLSVHNGNAGFSGTGANGFVDQAFSGAIADYRFFKWYNSTPVTLVEMANTYIVSSIAASSTNMANQSLTKIWTVTDPGVGYGSTPDYGTATSMIVTSNLTGSVDVSSLGSGTVYFFYGAYRTRPSFDATMRDAEGLQIDIPLLSFGDDDSANNTENYVTSIHFTNDGSYDTIDFTFNCTNGRFSGVVVTVDEPTPNTAPVFAVDPINGSDATENVAYNGTIAGAASDEDAGDTLAYAKVSGPAWLTVAADGTLTGTPSNSNVGPNTFTVSVTDGIAPAVEARLNIRVININDAPVWSADPIAGDDANEDEPFSGTLAGVASDVDAGASLTYAKVSGPAWLGVASNGTLSGTPDNADVGGNSFTVSVSDGISSPVTATLAITVINTNDAPTWSGDPITGAGATEGVAYSGTLAGSASDLDAGALLNFTKVGGPSWLTVAPNGVLGGTPSTADVGANSFTVSVGDGIAAPVQATLNVTVLGINHAPVWTVSPIVATDADEGVAYTGQSLAGLATDADQGDSITYSKVSGPAWLSVASDGTLSGTPPSGSVGLNSFVVRATDTASANAAATLEITVTGLPLPWVSTDIGTGMLEGSVTHDAGTFTQAGSGVIGGTSDNLRFTYQTLAGDGEIVARISGLENTGNSSRVGVMIRDTLAPNSKEIFMGIANSNGYRWARRTATGGNTSSSNSKTGSVPDTWVRLVRSGNTITAYKSTDGTSWDTVGSTTNTTFASTCYIGLAVGSGSDATLNTSQFSNVSVTP